MRFNLQVAYLSLLSVTCISSFFLFFVVFTENAKYVAAVLPLATDTEADAAAVDKAAVPHTTTNTAAAATPATLVHDEVLPNYKKVKEIINEGSEALQAAPEVVVPAGVNKLDDVAGAADDIASEGAANGWLLPTDAAVEVNLNAAFESDMQKQEEAKDDADIASASNIDDLQNKDAATDAQESLPDITEIPTITVTDLPFEILEPTRVNIDALIIDAAKETIAREQENHTMEMLENSSEVIRKDEEIIKFDDSGGGEQPQPTPQLDTADPTSTEIPQNIPNANVTIAAIPTTAPAATLPTQNESTSPATGAPAKDTDNANDNANASNTVNLTVEEVPIPVFSEWAQKQMENEKQQAKEQEVVNTATQKKNHTNGDGKRQAPLKMRNKNYASPDCGAKIIALNVDATNAGAVLSSSKDEYMLSPCGNRIWFVVELCEAIQAQKVELANFELFSSSPKNFTVSVSNRFPTRDWSNVGRFIAEDTRNIQGFDLHPHLFGKFVRVDIHSHYSKEHFCPLSLFRVFGTSEFEAFETEDTEHLDLDDFDDEFGQEPVHAKSADTNLFKSASDAVLSIVKKAAEVLAKPANHLNTTLTRIRSLSSQCCTPTSRQFTCADCNQSLVARINNVLSCEYQQLQALLKVPWLLKDLLRTRICAKHYGIVVKAQKSANENCTPPTLQSHILEMDVKRSYYLNMLPTEYVGALCQLLATRDTTKPSTHDANGEKIVTEPPLNLTIDKKLKKDDLRIIDNTQKKLVTTETTNVGSGFASTESAERTFSGDDALPSTTTESGTIEGNQLVRPPPQEVAATTIETSTTTAPDTSNNNNEPTLDVNIFNVPAQVQDEKQAQPIETANGGSQREELSSGEYSIDSSATTTTSTTVMPPPSSSDAQRVADMDDALTLQPTPPSLSARSEEDVASWENIDNLITSTTAAPGSGSDSGVASSEAAMQANQPGVNLQQKIPSGPQSESVFIRLSNRIKALERNMSLSGQYLEELSRRYKKQVEELQLTLTQTVQSVRTLEEHSRRQSELQQLLAERNFQLKDELDDLSLQIHACIVVIIFVGAFVFLALMVSILFYRSMRRETKEVLTLFTNANKKKTANAVAAMQRKLNRRKSFEDFSDHQQSCEKLRRPSEEALMILKERSSGREHDESIETVGDAAKSAAATQRERKISVCYSSNVGAGGQTYAGGAVVKGSQTTAAAQTARQRRKGEKHSWPNTEHAQQQARRHLAQLHAPTNDVTELKQNFEKFNGRPPRAPSAGESKSTNKLKRKSQAPRRQASVPNDFVENTAAAELSAAEYDESLRLEEDDLDNFIPTSDLAYNEFMPEGPSGYQVDDSVDGNAESKKSAKKLSRLSAPGFFKSPFGKNRNKLRTNKPPKHPHESTSWEWYRSKNADAKHALSGSASASGGFMRRASPTHSLDTSSLSEILLPNSRTENSFRILEEAILSSGESIATSSVTTTNGTNATTDNVFS